MTPCVVVACCRQIHVAGEVSLPTRRGRADERITLTQRDDEWLAGLVAAVRSDVAASHLLSRGESGRIVRLTEFHQRAFGVHERFPWIDIDARTERVIAADLSIVDHWSSYPEQVRNTHRARQVAFERELLALETHIAEDSIIIQHITVEYEPPHLVQVFDFDPKDLDRAKALNAEVFERIMTCTESHKWPTGLGGVRRISSALLDAQTLPDSGSTF